MRRPYARTSICLRPPFRPVDRPSNPPVRLTDLLSVRPTDGPPVKPSCPDRTPVRPTARPSVAHVCPTHVCPFIRPTDRSDIQPTIRPRSPRPYNRPYDLPSTYVRPSLQPRLSSVLPSDQSSHCPFFRPPSRTKVWSKYRLSRPPSVWPSSNFILSVRRTMWPSARHTRMPVRKSNSVYCPSLPPNARPSRLSVWTFPRPSAYQIDRPTAISPSLRPSDRRTIRTSTPRTFGRPFNQPCIRVSWYLGCAVNPRPSFRPSIRTHDDPFFNIAIRFMIHSSVRCLFSIKRVRPSARPSILLPNQPPGRPSDRPSVRPRCVPVRSWNTEDERELLRYDRKTRLINPMLSSWPRNRNWSISCPTT